MGKNCVYLSETEGIHDIRWRDALQYMGWHVGKEVLDSRIPIIAGPLTEKSISQLGQLKNPIIGLSWGWDLHAAKNKVSDRWLSNLSGLIVDSVPTRNIAIEMGMNPDSIVLIPWGIDLNVFTERVSAHVIDLTLLSLRAHEPLYRIDTILAAVELLQSQNVACSLTIGNEGTLTHELERMVVQRGIDYVNFIGHVQEEQLPQLFGQHGIYVSAAETDGTSVTLLQAMATGIPVVVSNSPGNSAWLDNSTSPTGTLFDLGDPFDLALKLNEVMASPERTKAMAHSGRFLVERDADWNQNIWQLDQLLNRFPGALF